jgi:hypothetical protein
MIRYHMEGNLQTLMRTVIYDNKLFKASFASWGQMGSRQGGRTSWDLG